MKYRYIFSIGTSQFAALNPDTIIKRIGLNEDDAKEWGPYSRGIDKRGMDDIQDADFLRNADHWIGILVPLFLKKLPITAVARAAILKGENPFGAEVSTLILHEQRRPVEAEQDQFYLLSSHTQAGHFAALLLAAILKRGWGIKEDIHILPIDCLVNAPVDDSMPEDAMESLAQNILTLVQRTAREDLQPVFLISGGFKSVIPCFTLFSLFFGVEMFYTFESSNILQGLHPSLHSADGAISSKWIKIVQSINDLELWDDFAPFFSVAFGELVHHPEKYGFAIQ